LGGGGVKKKGEGGWGERWSLYGLYNGKHLTEGQHNLGKKVSCNARLLS